MWTATVDNPRGRRRRAASRDALTPALSMPLKRGESSPNLLQYQHNHQHPQQQHYHHPNAQTSPSHNAFEGMLEPAIDGPPSPERLRQLSKQMKRGSYLNRPLPQHRSTASSAAASPLRSPSGIDRTAHWDNNQSFDSSGSGSLTRRSSNRSNDSGAQSRERESVQLLGRNLFQRTKPSKRASSSYSSSSSSMYSAEIPGEGSGSGLKDVLVPTLFARRKPSRDDTAQKKLQISGPFNFQHVTHTQRENLPSLQRVNRMELASEFSLIGSPGPATAPGALKGIEARDLPYDDFSVDPLETVGRGGLDLTDAPRTAPPPMASSRPALLPRHTAPALGNQYRSLKHAKSQEQLRSSPPRGGAVRSQSPTENGNSEAVGSSSPPVPPRNSSRQSLLPTGFSAFAASVASASASPGSSIDRPRTSSGFRALQRHASIDESLEQSPPATPLGFLVPSSPEYDGGAHGGDEGSASPGNAVTTPDDSAWPLTGSSYEKALPDVPEEDEHYHGPSHRSRISLTSNNSLRGSQSVPALRSFSQSQRPTSGHSDTLGSFDMMAAQRALRAETAAESGAASATPEENWEDVIDYCYEHEAEANFDYQWERPSMDATHDTDRLNDAAVRAAMDDEGLSEFKPPGTAQTSPGRIVASRHGSPLRSISSQSSMTGYDGAPFPSALPIMSNFSLPRGDKGNRVSQLKVLRPISNASSFKESHGFNLSPSLLIPNDYHQQMLQVEAERLEYNGDEEYQGPFFDESNHNTSNKSPLSYEQRSSTSTTATNSSSHFDMSGERHASANSAFTTLTRLTVSSSSTSLNKAAGLVTETIEPMPNAITTEVNTAGFIDDVDAEEDRDSNTTPPATKDTVPEMAPFPIMNFAKKPYHKSHASESVVMRDDVPGPLRSPLHSQDAVKITRRPRARTTSLSTQAPPVGQYALFPRNYLKSTGGQI